MRDVLIIEVKSIKGVRFNGTLTYREAYVENSRSPWVLRLNCYMVSFTNVKMKNKLIQPQLPPTRQN